MRASTGNGGGSSILEIEIFRNDHCVLSLSRCHTTIISSVDLKDGDLIRERRFGIRRALRRVAIAVRAKQKRLQCSLLYDSSQVVSLFAQGTSPSPSAMRPWLAQATVNLYDIHIWTTR